VDRYIRQRKTTHVEVEAGEGPDSFNFSLQIVHDLDKNIFSHPMTLAMNYPDNMKGRKFELLNTDGALKNQFFVTTDEKYFNLRPFELYIFNELET